MDVAFDNCALSEWRDPETRARVVERICALRARLVVPYTALVELGSGSDPEAVALHFESVAAVLDDLGTEQAGIGLPIHIALLTERWATQYRVPLVERAQLAPMFAGAAARERMVDLEHYLDKDRTYATDLSMKGELAKFEMHPEWPDTKRLVPGLLQNLLAPGAFGLEEIASDLAWLARIRAHPRNYPVAIMLAALNNLQATAATFPERARGGFARMLRVRRSDFADIWMTASVAGADLLVTNDAPLAERIHFIRAHVPGTRLRALSLGRFLSTDAAAAT